MIARIWRCIATADNVPRYIEHFEGAVLEELNALAGFETATILRREVETGVELTVMTFWASMDAIRRFAGEDAERAVVAPQAQAVLRSFDTTVTHYEVALTVERNES